MNDTTQKSADALLRQELIDLMSRNGLVRPGFRGVVHDDRLQQAVVNIERVFNLMVNELTEEEQHSDWHDACLRAAILYIGYKMPKGNKQVWALARTILPERIGEYRKSKMIHPEEADRFTKAKI